MTTDPLVVAELRAMFKAGATPSCLMRHIIAHHGQQIIPWTNKLIRAYFREAFGIPMFRTSAEFLDMGLRIAEMSPDVIQQMIANRNQWDDTVKTQDNSMVSWLDYLTATSVSNQRDKTQPESSSDVPETMNHLDDKTKRYLKDLIGYADRLKERVAILSTLSEQLQQQVLTLKKNESPTKDEAIKLSDVG